MEVEDLGVSDIPLSGIGGGEDNLNIGPYAEGLSQFVVKSQTPMTVGIQGEWGSGKTSLMRLVRRRIENDTDNNLITFWFETWQYGAMGDAETLGLLLMRDLAGKLLVELKEQEQLAYNMTDRLKGWLGQASKAVAASAISGSSYGLLDGQQLVQNLGTEQNRATEDMRELFQVLVSKSLEASGQDRVVVFIDDLDRIKPALAVRLLEVLKNFMDVQNCVFVVACDYDVVREGVKALMRIDDKDKVDAFFHKIFQVPFHMPVGAYSIDSMFEQYVVDKLITANGLGASKENTVKAFLRESFGNGEHAGTWFQQLTAMVEIAMGTNPRSFKRFLNVVDLNCCVDGSFGAGRTGAEDQGGSIAVWALHSEGKKRKLFPNDSPDTIRWLLTLFPVVALQLRWPEVAPYLLDEANEDSGIELGSIRLTNFERKVRTVVNDWPEAGEDEELGDFDDEHFQQLLRNEYETDGREDESGASARSLQQFRQLREFLDLWQTSLNNTDKRDYLTTDELAPLSRWSDRLGRMGRSRVQPGALSLLQETAKKENPEAGDGFAGLCSFIDHVIKRDELGNLKGSANSNEYKISARVGTKPTSLMLLLVRGSKLTIKLHATPRNSKWRHLPVAVLGERLVQQWQEEAGLLTDDMTGLSTKTITIDYGAWHGHGDKRTLRSLLRDFLGNVHVTLDSDVGLREVTPIADLVLRSTTLNASAKLYTDASTEVFAGSQVQKSQTKSLGQNAIRLRQELLERGVLVDESETTYRMVQDYRSPNTSLAAAVVKGQHATGNEAWQTEEGASPQAVLERWSRSLVPSSFEI